MIGIDSDLVPEAVGEMIRRVSLVELYWEATYTPCAGVAAVANQERRWFGDRGVMIAPWEERMASAQRARKDGLVTDTGWSFPVTGPAFRGLTVRVLRTTEPGLMPVLYLAAEGCFRGKNSPYDTPELGRDSVAFGVAVDELLTRAGATARQLVRGSDWETVFALTRVRQRHHTMLMLHNVYDSWLAPTIRRWTPGPFPEFAGSDTALRVGLESADVVGCVNPGFAYSLNHETIYTQILVPHLQDRLDRIVPIENANFRDLPADLIDLADQLDTDLAAGLRVLEGRQCRARAELPDAIGEKMRGRTTFVLMGRRCSQKCQDVAVEAFRSILRRDPQLMIHVVFATVAGDSGDAQRLNHIRALAEEFPDHVSWTDGPIEFFNALMSASDYHVMPSLMEPHGGLFAGSVVPIIRAIDGLASQLSPYEPAGRAAAVSALWHSPSEPATGFSFREEPSQTELEDLRELLQERVLPGNPTFISMRSALASVLERGIAVRRDEPITYAKLVRNALRHQMRQSWLSNLGAIRALTECAKRHRPL